MILEDKELSIKLIMDYKEVGFYRTTWLKYFLYEYEVSLMKKSKNKVSRLTREQVEMREIESVEHIYPENIRDSYWIEQSKTFNSREKNHLRIY